MKILLDNGHGEETPGKCSPVWPDGSRLREYEFARDIVRRIFDRLHARELRLERAPSPATPPSSLCSKSICRPMQMPRKGLSCPIHVRISGTSSWLRSFSAQSPKAPTPGRTRWVTPAASSGVRTRWPVTPAASKVFSTLRRLPAP